jgi:hypothetical protein
MKNSLYILLILILELVLNSLYFEYCVSRELPTFLTIIATVVVIILNVLAIKYIIKLIYKLLKI